MTRLGKKNVIVRAKRITEIATVSCYRTIKGVFCKSVDGRRVYLTPIQPTTINGYLCEFEITV